MPPSLNPPNNKKRNQKMREKESKDASLEFTPSSQGDYHTMWVCASNLKFKIEVVRNLYTGNLRFYDTTKDNLEKPKNPGEKEDCARRHNQQILTNYLDTNPQARIVFQQLGVLGSPICHFKDKINTEILLAFLCSQEAIQFYYSIPFLMICRCSPHYTRPRHIPGKAIRNYRKDKVKINKSLDGFIQLANFIEQVQGIAAENIIDKRKPVIQWQD
ncbi:hypothetical protein FGO68_gene17208 [Halteria grandinella]|uniref:Uncharacterized protein n=1 Tax=Halteria grandinella TaxID=5974 RepID=A0A8J8T2T0_HALGN|nr:hypothetical protein FGO68_gene17208 [Halteria grandinella]